MEDYCKLLLEDFLKNSFSTVEVLVEGALNAKSQKPHGKVTLFRCVNGKKVAHTFTDEHFYLRGSVEYTNPQVTVEEIQGVVGARLLETCANYYVENGLHEPNESDIKILSELLKEPSGGGYVVAFLLNTDDVEPDRYSINPLRQSLVDSGQSAFPAGSVTTGQLSVDEAFVKKYNGSLISQKEAALVDECLKEGNGSYLDLVDLVKDIQLIEMSEFFGMDLSLYSLRMPIATLKNEGKEGLLHHIISESHKDYSTIEQAYTCMGRSMAKRTTLLTVPHSKKGFGSKRAARGKLHFDNGNFIDASVTYKTTALYPNGADPKDIAVAVCDDSFTVNRQKFVEYSYTETPSSPQFFLYSLGSPEDAAIWHGIGAFGSFQLLQSYSSARSACMNGKLIKDLDAKYNVRLGGPLHFNLVVADMWRNPAYNNIDASIGSLENLADLTRRGMRMEYLSAFK
jgi:hypothetical protein